MNQHDLYCEYYNKEIPRDYMYTVMLEDMTVRQTMKLALGHRD